MSAPRLRRVRGLLSIGATVVALASTCVTMAEVPRDALQAPSAFASVADRDARARALFTEAGKVLQHPRCVNCHPRTDRPLQGDAMKVHEPPVTRGRDGHGAVGMTCDTCHNRRNFDPARLPGHENWHLAPASMAWEGKSLREICVQIKDRARNGNKSLAQIVEHMAHDSLVGWGWNPGAGLTPAPGTQQSFGELIKAWADAGAACPT